MTKRLKGIPNLPFAPIVAALFGVVAAILVFATPAWLLERTVGSLGISSVLPAAQPPLGDTARALIALATGVLAFLTLWLIMRPIERLIHKRRTSPGFATAAQAVPAAVDGSRSPIFAGDELGAPFMSDEALASGEELFLEPAMIDQSDTSRLDAPAPSPAYDPLAFELPPVAARANLEPDLEWSQPARSEPLEIEWPKAPSEPIAAEVEIEEAEGGSMGGSIEFVSVSDEPEPAAEPVLELPPVIVPEPVDVETEVPAPVALTWPTLAPTPDPVEEPAPAAAPASASEPSLQDLLRRFEAALDSRRTLAAQGAQMSEPPAFGTVASLRDLIESQNKNAA